MCAFATLALAVLSSSFFLLSPDLEAQEKPLPDGEALFAVVRENLARAGRQQDQYAYKERRTELHTNPFGRLGTGDTLLYDVTPLVPGPGFTRTLLARDGEPVVDGEVERVGERRRRRRDRAQSPSAIQDAASVLDFAIDRRDFVAGKPAIVVTFTPKPDAEAATRAGRMARSFKGTIWIDEAMSEVMRVEATAVDSISYGFGIIARLGEGSRVTLVREPVEGGIWLPTSIRFKGEGRALLLRKLHVDFGIDWFDYRKVVPD